MFCIREDYYGGLSEHIIFQLITSYWYDMYKSRNNPGWWYFWWKVEFRWQVIEALERKWTCDLPDFTFFIKKTWWTMCWFWPKEVFRQGNVYRKIGEDSKTIKKKKKSTKKS